MITFGVRLALGIGLLAGIGAATAIAISSRKRSKRGLRGLDYDPYASLLQTKSSDVNPAYEPPKDDEGSCLIIGREHRLNPDAPYRVCLSANQQRVLFEDKLAESEKLGCGVFACAYSTPDKSRVVKFTRDSEDVAALIKAQKTGVVPKIYKVYELKERGHSTQTNKPTPFYALVMERLRTIPIKERDELDMRLPDISEVSAGKMTGTEFCENREDQYGAKCDDVELAVVKVAEKLRDAGIKWQDIHSGNIGYDSRGKLKALDLGLTKTQLKRRLKILEGLGRASKISALRLV